MNMKELEKWIEFDPAWDKSNTDPTKDYGIHGVDIRWYCRGEKGVIQFVISTNWYLNYVQDRLNKDIIKQLHVPQSLRRFQVSDQLVLQTFTKPMGSDVGVHSYVPLYKGQKVLSQQCELLNSKACYYYGSGLRAEEWLQILIEKGGTTIWKMMEDEYQTVFHGVTIEEV